MDTNIYRKLYILIIVGLLFTGLGAYSAFAAPEITNDELTSVADNLVVLTWVTSNEPSNTGIEYGIGFPTTTYVTDEGSNQTIYHYLTLSNLYPDTLYTYRIFSKNASGETTYGQTKSFQTLDPPSGQLLFTFASISDPQISNYAANTYGARGRPYTSSEAILQTAISTINSIFNPSFTVIKGDLIDDRSTNKAADASSVQTDLGNLTNPVFPVPGNHDKASFPAKTWYTALLKPIFDPANYTPTAGFSNASYEADLTDPTKVDSVYNYSFDFGGYHFIFLDSLKAASLEGYVNTTWLNNDLTANSGKVSFIFMHYDITSESVTLPDEVLREVTGTPAGQPVNMTLIDLENRSAFLSVMASHESNIAGVFMGHIHDNARYNVNNLSFPFVRTAATVQFPVGYNFYKVYSNGYMQTFYKVPYYTEYAREFITPEAGYSDAYWEQFSLASNYDRNFVHTYGEIAVPPTIQNSAPTNNAADVALNQSIIITFTKQMSTTDTQNAITIAPDVSGKSYSWSNNDTILTISHSNFAASTAYTVSVGTSAKSTDNIPFASVSSFSFTSGTTATANPPQIAINRLTNDITDDPTPTLTGVATDENSTITNIEYRLSSRTGSSWNPCTPLDGAFDSTQEAFTFTVSPEAIRGQNSIELRGTNAAGVTTQTGYTTYTFYYVGARPEIILKADGSSIINGDPIKSNPSFEVIVATDKGLNLSNLSFLLDQSAVTATSTNQINNTTITYAYYHPTLSEGTHSLRVVATDNDGNISTKEATNLIVQTTGDAKIFGVPLNYPNPFDPGTQTTTISYNLSRSSNITLSIFDMAGTLISKTNYTANQAGGQAGYNEVTWDGRSASGNLVGNGIYIYLVIADGKVIQNGKGKITVFKQ